MLEDACNIELGDGGNGYYTWELCVIDASRWHFLPHLALGFWLLLSFLVLAEATILMRA